MSPLKNQKGAALVLVLLIITVMMLFIPLLLYQLNNANVQFSKTEEQVQAENMAEMGVDYFNVYVEESLKKVEKIDEFDLPESIGPINIAANETFQIKDITIDEKYIITFTSMGIVNETNEEVTRTVTITIE